MTEEGDDLMIIDVENEHFIKELREFKKMISSHVGVDGTLNMFVTGGGYVQLTSSSKQLLNHTDQFNNPLIQLVINVMKNQKDFGFYVGIMISSVLENSLIFEKNKLLANREELVNFLMEVFPVLCDTKRMKIPLRFDSVIDFISLVKTTLKSKFAHRLSRNCIDELSTVIVKSFLYSLDVEDMKLGKISVRTQEGREMFKYYPGVFYELIDVDDDWITDIVAKIPETKLRILLFTTSLDPSGTDTHCDQQYTVAISKDVKRKNIFEILENAISCDVRVIACQKVVNIEVRMFLRRKSVIVIHRMGTELAKQVENITHAFPISHLEQISLESINKMFGSIDNLDIIEFGDRQYLRMKNNASNTGTLFLQEPSFSCAQLKIVVEQALNVLQNSSSKPYVCPGGGCFEVSLWSRIQELGRKKFIKIPWEWLLKAFIEATGRKLPLWSDSVFNHAWKDEECSSCNCGLVRRDMAEALSANWTFLNSFDSKIVINDNNCFNIETLRISSESVVDLFYSKVNAISISFETCLNLCSIGKIIYKKRI